MHRRKFANNAERGQILLIAALFMTALLGFTAMAIDVGLIFHDRRGQQNAADAAALAGAASLPDPLTAVLRARDWADRNGYGDGTNGTTVTVNTPYKGEPTKIEGVIKKPVSAVFSRALGEFVEAVRGAVRRNDVLVEADLEGVQRLGGVAHGRPIGLAPHDDRDGFGRHARPLSAPAEKKAPYRRRASREASGYDSLTMSGRS